MTLRTPVFLFAILLGAQECPEIKFEHLAQGYRFTEGPAWNAKDQYLVFSDTPSDRLMKWVPGSDVAVLRTEPHGPARKALDPQGPPYPRPTRHRPVTRAGPTGQTQPRTP